MALVLRQSTAVDVLIGPFVDSTDGVTAETALTISQADVLLSKNGQALTQKNDDTAAAHDANGYYNCELDATDTDTVGTLVLTVTESGALPVRHEFQVIEEAAYDALYAASAVGPLLANDTGDGFSAIPWNSAWDAEVQSEVADALAAYDPPTNAEMVARTLAAADYATATNLATVDTVVDGIKTVTDNLPDSGALTSLATASALATVDGNVDAILEDTGTTLPATLVTIAGYIDTEVAAIKAVTDNLPDSGALTSLATAASLATVDTVVDAIKVTTDKLDDTLEDSGGGAYIFTEASLAQAPTGEGSGASAQEVWEYATRTLTALDEDSTTLDIDAAVRGAVGLASANLDTQIAALPTAAENRAEMDSNSTQLAAILEDTGTTLPATLSTIAGYLDTEIAAILVDTGTTLDGKLDTIDTVVDAIKAVTDNLPDSGALTSLATASALATVDSNVDAVLEDTGTTIPSLISALENLSADEVASEIADALGTDTIAELTGDPGATPTIKGALMLLYMALRNRRDTTASSDEITDNSGSTILVASVSDDGTTFSKGEYGAP